MVEDVGDQMVRSARWRSEVAFSLSSLSVPVPLLFRLVQYPGYLSSYAVGQSGENVVYRIYIFQLTKPVSFVLTRTYSFPERTKDYFETFRLESEKSNNQKSCFSHTRTRKVKKQILTSQKVGSRKVQTKA